MDSQDEMMMEEELLDAHSGWAPAEAEPAAALTAGPSREEENATTPEEEWENAGSESGLPPEPEVPAPRSGDEAEAESVLPAAPREQERLMPSPGVPAPAAEKDDARRRYWQGVLTGAPASVPASVRRRAGVDEGALPDSQREYRLCSAINRSWVVDHLGLSRDEVRSDWPRVRSQLAARYHVADDEQELFAALSVEAQDAPRREAVIRLYEEHCRAALLGQEAPALPAEGEQAVLPYAAELADEARRKGEALRQRHFPLARELAEGLEVFAAMEEDAISAPRLFASVPELVRSVEALADMDERSRLLVYTLAQSELRSRAPQCIPGQESLYRTVLRAVRRGSTQLGYSMGQAVTHAAVASLSSLGSMLGEERGRSLREGAAGLDLCARIVDEARRLLHEEVKPLDVREEAGLAGQLLVDAAGATPSAIVAFSGGAGFASLGLSGLGHSVAEARARAPQGSQQLQYFAGVMAGAIQASVYAGMSRVGGQLLSNSISRFARASGQGTCRYVLPSLGVLGAVGVEDAKLLAAGKLADAAGLGAQELAARVERTASNIDWTAYGHHAQDIELNMREAAMALPFVLIASGRVALRHFRSRHAVLGEGQALLDWGIDEGTREAIMKEQNVDRQGEMLREALCGSRRWSAPGFLAEAMRALRLLNTDYYQGFKEPQVVAAFLRLPAEGSLVPRPPLRRLSPENPEHVRLLMEQHGSGEKANRGRIAQALVLWDEWCQKAHLIQEAPGDGEEGSAAVMPTSARRRYFGLELLRLGNVMPSRMRPGGFYAPHAEAERMALLRDRVAELHDLSYQMLLSSFSLDALSHSTRDFSYLRKNAEASRLMLLEGVGRAVLRRATGMPEPDALAELGQTISGYFARRRYRQFPPAWMSRVESVFTRHLDDYAMATALQELPGAEPELLHAFRVALGFKSCANALYELLPATPDFQTALAGGMSPAEAYVHLLSRELGVELGKAKGVEEMLAPLGGNSTDMRAYSRRNLACYEAYRLLTGHDVEPALGGERQVKHWRVRRPNGRYTRWHRRRYEAVNDMAANASFMFMPFSHDRLKALSQLEPGKNYNLGSAGAARSWQFTGYDQLCRTALRDSARVWLERAPYALPGFALHQPRYFYLGGAGASTEPKLQPGRPEAPGRVQVNSFSLTTPLSLARARFYTYWWQQLNAGLLSPATAGEDLVKMRAITPEEWQRVQDIAKPPLMPRNPDVPLKETPPPDVPGMHRALAGHLTDASLRYFLVHMEEMPLPASAREWYKLAPFCTLEPGVLPRHAMRLSLHRNDSLLTCWANRTAARELRELAPGVDALRRAEREGLLMGSVLPEGIRRAAGLNRHLNLEQAWCAQESGMEAFMSTDARFWYLMEHPVQGWQALSSEEQAALRRHLEPVCRLEPAPAAVEAEARGETTDGVQEALYHLQEVLQDYPVLHQYGVAEHQGLTRFRRLFPEEQTPAHAPFEEPEYEVLPLYTGGSMKPGFRLGEPGDLPEELQGDGRVLPALHLLHALRCYPGSRPYARHEGIQWQGRLYGGEKGLLPAGMEGRGPWYVTPPLSGLIYMLRKVDDLKQTLLPGELPRFMDVELDGLGEGLNLSPLVNVTCYRDEKNPAHICRLMPGEPHVGNPDARLPYVVHALEGTYMYGNSMLTAPEKMHQAYMPLERFEPFRPFHARVLLKETRRANSRAALDYTLSGVLSSTMRMAGQERSTGGLVSMRELLLRFAEDSGLSDSLLLLDPADLTYGQLLSLSLAREMLLNVCGAEPEAAYRRLIRLSHRIRRSASSREAVLRTLSATAERLYEAGDSPFLRETSNRRQRRNRWSLRSTNITGAERRSLDAWIEERNRLEESMVEWTRTNSFMEGYNDRVRSDGYSRGFFDD